MNFLACFILDLFKVRTVNLAEIAQSFPGIIEVESKYRRIQRFICGFKVSQEEIARCIGTWLPQGPWILSLDRTDWRFGDSVINLLVLGVVFKGTAVPLLWIPLNKKGHSDTQERQQLIDKFLNLFGRERIQYLTADREFIGAEWLKGLQDSGIRLCLRIKKNTLIEDKDGTKRPAHSIFAHLPIGMKRGLKRVRVWGCWVHVEGMRLKNGQYLIVIAEHRGELSTAINSGGILKRCLGI